jgi:hypothetical protein
MVGGDEWSADRWATAAGRWTSRTRTGRTSAAEDLIAGHHRCGAGRHWAVVLAGASRAPHDSVDVDGLATGEISRHDVDNRTSVPLLG